MTERPLEVYLDRVRVPLARLRLDPLRLDWLVAGILTLGLELEVWLGSGAAHHRLVAAVAGPLTAAADRRARTRPGRAGGGGRGTGPDRPRAARRDRAQRLDDRRAGRGRTARARCRERLDPRGAADDRADRPQRVDRDAPPGRHAPKRHRGRAHATAWPGRRAEAGDAGARGRPSRRAQNRR